MTATDPWLVLGLAPGSSLVQARVARRRLAKQLHPDLHTAEAGDEQARRAAHMTAVNRAFAEIEAILKGHSPEAAAAPNPGWTRGRRSAQRSGPADPDSFSVACLPVEAFEALFLAAYALGDILVADEPYLLELYLVEPACFCRLTLAPEAGGSLVAVEVSPAGDGGKIPAPGAVIEVLVAELNALVSG
jgi:hypothetical protein